MGFYPRLYSRIFLYLLALASVIYRIMRRFDYRLVAAPPKRQINSISRKFIILRISKAVQADSYTDRHRHLISNVHGFDIFQQIKAILLQVRNRLFSHDHKELVLFHLPTDPIHPGNVLVHFPVNQGNQQRAPYLFHAFQRFLIIIQINQPYCKALVIHFLESDL